MKLIYFVFLFALVATSSAVTLKAKARAVLKALSETTTAGPSFKTAFKNLLQLADADEYQQVHDILGTVRDEIQALLDSTKQKLDDENEAYNTQLQALETTINSLQSQITQIQDDHDGNVKQRENIQEIIQNAGSAISDAVASRETEVQRRQTEAQAARDNVNAINQAKAQCDLAISLLQQAAEQDLSSSDAAFLEVRRKRLHNSLLEVGKKIKQIKLNSHAVPFIESLINIAQSTVNEEDINQIIALITDLKNSLEGDLQRVISDDEQDQATSVAIVSSLDATIEAQQSILTRNQEALTAIIRLIETQESEIAKLQEALDTAVELLNNLDEAHATRSTTLQELIDRLIRDIASLDQALSFLASQMS